MNSHTKNLTRSATLVLAALVAGVIAVLLAASHPSSANALPPALATYAPQLLSVDGIHVNALPSSTTLPVSQSAAQTVALQHFGKPLTSDASTFAVSATDDAWGTPQSDGTMQLKISNRPVWVVLVPNITVEGNPGPGQPETPRVTATLAVFVDGNTGDYLMAATVYP